MHLDPCEQPVAHSDDNTYIYIYIYLKIIYTRRRRVYIYIYICMVSPNRQSPYNVTAILGITAIETMVIRSSLKHGLEHSWWAISNISHASQSSLQAAFAQ